MIVGTVYSEESLAAARALEPVPAAPDLLELRVDCFAGGPEVLAELAAQPPRELILTVRAPAEGGCGDLEPLVRQSLYERFSPFAGYVDLELASIPELANIADQARQLPGGLIASCHDFAGTPSLDRLQSLAGQAVEAGAAIFKVAARVENSRQLAGLLEFLATETRLPLAVMGMGPLGRLSRLAAAAMGSRLNYGYLGSQPQVPGQWPAALLRERLDELSAP